MHARACFVSKKSSTLSTLQHANRTGMRSHLWSHFCCLKHMGLQERLLNPSGRLLHFFQQAKMVICVTACKSSAHLQNYCTALLGMTCYWYLGVPFVRPRQRIICGCHFGFPLHPQKRATLQTRDTESDRFKLLKGSGKQATLRLEARIQNTGDIPREIIYSAAIAYTYISMYVHNEILTQ